MRITIHETGSVDVAAELTNTGLRAAARSQGVLRHYGAVVQAQVRANTRPSWVDYRKSIGLRTGTGFAAVGTDEPQGFRLENGFMRSDRLGRRYRQRPFPHFGPAVDRHADSFAVALAAAVSRP